MKYFLPLINTSVRGDFFLYGFIFSCVFSFVAGILVWKKRVRMKSAVALSLLISYLIPIFLYTVFARPALSDFHFTFLPFWSYGKIFREVQKMPLFCIDAFWYNVLNIFMFLPVGIFLPMLFDHGTKIGRRGILFKTAGIAFLLSLHIEILQLILKRGLFEFDDLFHNTAGALVGAFLYFRMKAVAVARIKVRKDAGRLKDTCFADIKQTVRDHFGKT